MSHQPIRRPLGGRAAAGGPPDCDVVIVGAGPSGLLLASELKRLDVDVILIEQRASYVPGSRAIGVHPPTLAALEPSGATEQILSSAAKITRGVAMYSWGHRDSRFLEAHPRRAPSLLGGVRFDRDRHRFPFVASVPQQVTEAAVGAGAPPPIQGVRAVSVEQSPGIATVRVEDEVGRERLLNARFVVVAAGASGRELLRPFFRGRQRKYSDRYVMSDLAEAPGQPPETAIITLGTEGVIESFPLPNGGRRLVAWVGSAPALARADAGSAARQASAEQLLAEAVASRTRNEALAAQVTKVSEFGIRRVLLSRMIAGRVIAIGDAAHEVSPIGGQGMNLGLLDAATLAPAISSVLRNRVPPTRARPNIDAPAPALLKWERDRLASARTAARLATLNTVLGRPQLLASACASTALIKAAMTTPLARLPEHAYAMGFDRAG